MSTALQAIPDVGQPAVRLSDAPVLASGKFLHDGDARFLIKGVAYGTFAPDEQGCQFPPPARIAEDFRLMAGLGINTVRTYTPPSTLLLDEAARHGLRVMIGLPWSQHVAFLDDRQLTRTIRREIGDKVRELAGHPAALMFALGNEIPPGVVRWHGSLRVERFLRDLYQDAKAISPASLFTYVNFPPTEFLDLSFFDVCAFNVYLHREPELRAYLTRLQHIAGYKPLLLAEAGADSIREGEEGQAAITAMHMRAAFEEGACGAVAFSWTDEWWRGGHEVDDWAFGLVDRERRMKPAAVAVAQAFSDAPFPAAVRASWPKVSVVVCAYNAADTLEDCLASLDRLTYPDYEVILVNDGSRDATGDIGRRHARVRVIDVPNAGLSAARNVGLAEARGEIIAYTDADTRVDPDWLTFLIQPFQTSDVVGSGGPNVVPPDDPPIAQCCRARAGRPDARAARRPDRRARAGLQHGLPPRRAPRDRRLQPDLSPRRRRCRCVLAAAGARMADRVLGGGARLAPPPDIGQRLLAPAGRLRRGRNLADGAPPRQVPGRAHAVARPHLQPAAVRAIALGRAGQRGRLGNRRVSVGVPRRRSSVRVHAALDLVADRVVCADAFRHRRRGDRDTSVGGRAAPRERPRRSGRHRREKPRVRDAVRRRVAARRQAVVPRDGRLSALHSAAGPGARTDSRHPRATGGCAADLQTADEPRPEAFAP